MHNHLWISSANVNYLRTAKFAPLIFIVINVTQWLPLQVIAINCSTCAASWAPTYRCRPWNRTWWHGVPGFLRTPFPSRLPTLWVQRCSAWWWIWQSSSSTVYLSSLPESVRTGSIIKVQRSLQPNSVPAAESLGLPAVTGHVKRSGDIMLLGCIWPSVSLWPLPLDVQQKQVALSKLH